MPLSFNCPNCGAPLDYQGRDPIIRCPYCKGSVVVPENLRSGPSFSSQQSDHFRLNGVMDMNSLLEKARAMKQVKDLAEQGGFDQAVALYRQQTGLDEFQARQAVEALAAGRPVTLTGFTAADVAAHVQIAQAMGGSLRTPASTQVRSAGCGGVLIAGCSMMVLTLVVIFIALMAAPGGINSVLAGFGLPALSLPGSFATQELSFGGEGSGPGLFSDVRAIAVDPSSGDIYAAEFGKQGRIQAFDAQGNFKTQWIIEAENPYIQDMETDRQGRVYVCASGNIYRYDSRGKLLDTFKAYRGEMYIGYYDNFAVLPDGKMVAISHGDDIIWLDENGEFIRMEKEVIASISNDSELGGKVAVDGLGNIFIVGPFNGAVFKFDSKGKYINRFGEKGDKPGQLRAPGMIAIDRKGRVYISDTKGIQVFSNDGRYLNVISIYAYAYGLTFDDQSKLYLTTNKKTVERYGITSEEE